MQCRLSGIAHDNRHAWSVTKPTACLTALSTLPRVESQTIFFLEQHFRYGVRTGIVPGCVERHCVCDERRADWQQRIVAAMFHLDSVSCALTVLSTVLVGKKLWTGLVVAGVNSVVICVIGLRTAQFGFIPANLFCIGVYAVSLRSWMGRLSAGLTTESTEIEEKRTCAS
jgi:hypothetical protein